MNSSPITELLSAVPHLQVEGDQIVAVSADLARELGCDPTPLLGPLEAVGQRLDDASFDDVLRGDAAVRVRLGADLLDRPVRLRRIWGDAERTLLEVRSLADEFRLEKLLRRNPYGHMLLTPGIELQWSMTSNDLAETFPGDNPLNWVELMDADDMTELGKAIHAVGKDPNLRRTVRHRLNADRTYAIIDTVESALHDPDLRGVLVRSRREDSALDDAPDNTAPYAGTTVSDHMPIGVVLASDQGRILHRNAAAAELVGAKAGMWLVPGEDPWIFDQLEPEASARFLAVFAAATAGTSGHCTLAAPSDRHRSLRVSVSPALASTVVISIEDNTELAEAERALRASNRLLEALDAHSEDLVLVFDVVGRTRYVSSSARRHIGDVTIEQAADLLQFVHPSDRQIVDDLLRRVRSKPATSGNVEFRLASGERAPARWHAATMTNLVNDPDVQGFVVTLRDIHERHLVERELRFKATHDALTTLPDRAAFQSQLEALLSEAERSAQRTALLFCDVDNFKRINDRAGHRIGDLVLTEVAVRLRDALRSTDFVGRFGGDEFVVVAPNVDDEDHALALAQRVFDTVVGAAQCDGVEVDVSLSMGVAVTDEECVTATGLLHRADLAMYEAKRLGRGRIAPYSSQLDLDGGNQSALRADLRRAIDVGQLTVHYQPIIALRPGLRSGFESLARWNHPQQGLINAARFIAVAESAGMIDEISDALLGFVCTEVVLSHDDTFVSVNVSASQLGHRDAAAALLDFVLARGFDPSRLVVELTEAAFAQGPTVQANLEYFRSAGVRIFLDDFGVGYSSLSHLHRFPVDGIKIDASIVNPVVDENLVRLIVGVARTLGVATVAEGVETPDQLAIVRSHGVDYVQGFLLGRPSPTPAMPDVDLVTDDPSAHMEA